MDQVLHLIAAAQAFLQGISPAAWGIAATVIEFGLRLFKSQKPLSILYGIGAMIKKVGGILVAAGALFSSVAEAMDKVLPQNVQPAPSAPDQQPKA